MKAEDDIATRVELVLDQEGKQATFSMHGPTWKGGALRFELVPRTHGFAVRDDDEADPLDERFAAWEAAVEAFADLVRLHVGDELSPSGIGQREADPDLKRLSADGAERIRRAVFGPNQQ